MTPGARIAAAIELLANIDGAPRPADQVVAAYTRKRRYIGSKDRRALTEMTFAVLRRRARLDWWLGKAGADAIDARGRVVAYLALEHGLDRAGVTALFDGGPYASATLTASEENLVAALAGQSLETAAQPPEVRGEVPDWLLPRLQASLGATCAAELQALTQAAPVDLRVNRLKGSRSAARAALADGGILAAETPLSPLGLRLSGRPALQAAPAFRDGLVEPQDEASQLAALLTGARPGMAVLDVCAGAGGKTLALAAEMAGQGRLLAMDRDAARLERAKPRLARAGCGGVELRPGTPAELAAAPECAAGFDRVLVDAPCSGSGTWRRHPDARWRLGAVDLDGYLAVQREILRQAAGLVAPGGRLIYVTCSLLAEENCDQIAAFLADRPAFQPLPVEAVWAESIGGSAPASGDESGLGLTLTPQRHDTDGFFIAALGSQMS